MTSHDAFNPKFANCNFEPDVGPMCWRGQKNRAAAAQKFEFFGFHENNLFLHRPPLKTSPSPRSRSRSPSRNRSPPCPSPPRTRRRRFLVHGATALSLVSKNPLAAVDEPGKRRLNRGRSIQPSNLPPTHPHAYTRQNPPPERSQQSLPQKKLNKPNHACN